MRLRPVMGRREDINGLKSVWKDLSLLSKVIFGTLLVSQFLTVASIADQVIKLRGFIVTAIERYQLATEPVRVWLIEHVGVILTRAEYDSLILGVLMVAAVHRAWPVGLVKPPESRCRL